MGSVIYVVVADDAYEGKDILRAFSDNDAAVEFLRQSATQEFEWADVEESIEDYFEVYDPEGGYISAGDCVWTIEEVDLD